MTTQIKVHENSPLSNLPVDASLVYQKKMIESNLDLRFLEESDYEVLKSYWKWHRFPVPPRNFLPDNLSNGLMITYKGMNLCSGFLYGTTSSSLFWLEFIVSNPEIKDKNVRRVGLRYLIEKLKTMVLSANGKYIYTSLINEHLKQAFLDCGFILGSKGTDELVCNL